MFQAAYIIQIVVGIAATRVAHGQLFYFPIIINLIVYAQSSIIIRLSKIHLFFPPVIGIFSVTKKNLKQYL